MKLKIGRFSYSNLFPIFHMLERECDCSEYEFVEGVPSDLNKEIREGEIDVSPSSSIEYLRHPDKYDLLDNHSISSKGPVGSIFLFSKRPVETLNGLTVLTSSQSETSVALLKIMLNKFYDIKCSLKSSSLPIAEVVKSNAAYLLIGDEALREALKWPKLFIYDIGEMWYKNTGLPSVFALWITRKDCCKEKAVILERFKEDLLKAKNSALKNFESIVKASPLKNVLSEEELVSYWEGISYDFTDEHRKGLELFRRYCKESDLI